MARLWSSGFELNSLSGGMEFTTITSTPTIITSLVKSGTYALNVTGGAVKDVRTTFSDVDANGPFYTRVYINITTLPSTIGSIVVIMNNANTTKSRIRLATSGALELWDATGVVGGQSAVLSTATWYMLELSFYNNTVTGKTEMAARLNGVQFASTIEATNTGGANKVTVGNASGVTTVDMTFDDWAINDSTGTIQNSFPGEGKIIHLRPNGAGDSAQWARAGTDSGANWSQVDEALPNDATDYVSSSTVGHIDLFNIENSPLTSTDIINFVAVGIRAGGAGASSGTKSAPVLIKASGGTQKLGTEFATNSAWMSNKILVTANNFLYLLIAYKDPDEIGWSNTNLNTTQIGYKKTIVVTMAQYVSTVYAQIEYIADATRLSTDFMEMEFTAPSTPTLVVADSFHSHTADSVIVDAPVTFTLSTDLIEFLFEVVLILADSSHSHSADNVVLTQNTTLTVSDALHAHTVDNIALVMDLLLTVQETLHSHEADNVVVSSVVTTNAAKFFPFFG